VIIERLSETLGAAIIGLDLRKPLDSATLAKIHDAWVEHQVLVFRDQELTIEQQLAAVRQFGPIEPHPLKTNTNEHPEITISSNVVREGNPLGYIGPPFALWHSDLCYLEEPAKMTFLYAHTVPEKNGDTWFANMYTAYDQLPAELRVKVEGRRAVFSLNYNLVKRCASKGYHLPLAEEDVQPDSLHPVVRTHPYSKKKALFVNWAHTDAIEGYEPEESQRLLDQLFAFTTEERFLYRHKYRRGDLITWDNASTLHTHCPDPPNGDRIMIRAVVRGTKPFYVG
jgi:taurine dioxygenase